MRYYHNAVVHCHGYCSSENSSIDLYDCHENSLNYLNNSSYIINNNDNNGLGFQFYSTANDNKYFGGGSYTIMVISVFLVYISQTVDHNPM